ncbi:MAG TPA: TonB-dependent receptor plug domain-containing protein [Opitutaceae bacterium]|jgi:outer membrane receptor protein involved in Fe transport
MRFLLPALAVALSAARASAEPVNFAIPAEPAGPALLDFSRQSGCLVLFSPDDLRHVAAHPIHGWFEPADALYELLSGTHFVAQANGRSSFIIVAAPAARPELAPVAPPPPAPAENQAAMRMNPFMVQSRTDPGTGPINASSVAMGNLDLPRSENDALPYLVYSRDQVVRSGQTSLDDFLRQEVLESDPTPGLGQGGGNNNGQTSAFFNGSTNVNLRAFGSDETMVLVNGLPMPTVLSGINGGSAFERQADVDMIPLNLVERVEILPISAAALYSGNPVGGVINVVLRPVENIDEFTATYTNGIHVDAPTEMFSLLHGQTLLGGKLSYRLAIAVNRSTPANEQELGLIAKNLATHPGIDDPPDTFIYRATPNILTLDQAPLFGPGSPDFTSVAPGADGSGGLAAFTGREGVPSLGLFRAPGGMASSPVSLDYAYGARETSETYFGTATYDLFPSLQLGVQGLMSHQINSPGYDIFQDTLLLKAGNPLNPFGQEVNVSLAETAPRVGQGYDEARLDTYSGVAGLLLKLPGNWRLSADAEYSHSLTGYRGLAGVDDLQWQKLVDDGEYNPLRDPQVYPAPDAFYGQVLEYFGRPGKFLNLDNYQDADGAVRLTDQSINLPTGLATVSLGVDYNLQYQASFNDDQFYGDGQIAPSSGYWTGRTLQQFSTAVEGQASLLPPAWRPRVLTDLRFDAAARYNTAKAGAKTGIAPSFGLKADLAGGFALRASVTNTNRFPTATTARFVPIPGGNGTGAGGPITGVSITDPLRRDTQYDITTSTIPTGAILPEADVTESFGLVFERGAEQHVRFSADWFSTHKSEELDFLGADEVINNEAYLPGWVTRAPPTAGDPYPVGQIVSVLTGNVNLAWRHSENWDFAFDYGRRDIFGGDLDFYVRYVYFQRFDVELVPHSPVIDELRDPDTASLDLVRHRINAGASWSNRHFGFGLEERYFAPRVIPLPQQLEQGSNHIGSFRPFDVYVKGNLHLWDRRDRRAPQLSAELRVNNVLNDPLPKFPTDPSSTGVEAYGDWRGQSYSFSVTVSY